MTIKKIFLLAVFCLAFSINLFATAQYPDLIIYQGKTFSLHANPLEDYFEKHPNKKPKTEIMSTALWRGYVATFEFVDNQLCLKDIRIQVRKKDDNNSFETESKSVISDVVPQGKLKIDWFTGILVLPFGEVVNYVHMGYGSTYENYILLEVDNGSLNKSKELNYKKYEEFKQKQFEAFKKTEEYKKLFNEIKKKNKNDDKFIEEFLKDFVINYSTKILVD